MRKFVKELWGDSLYRNSLYLILNSFVMALFGFAFWSIAAKSFNSVNVGLATAVISAVSLVGNLSLLGFNVSILKFKDRSLNFTSLIVSGIVSLFVGALFLLFVHTFSPRLDFLTSSWKYILAFMAFGFCTVTYMLMNSMLISQGKGNIVLLKDFMFSLVKVVLLFIFSGLLGLLISWYAGILFAVLISLFFIHLKKKWFSLREVFHFSFFSYLNTLLSLLPGLVLPLFVVHYFGASYGAYFYMAWMISNLLFIIPIAMGQNLLRSGDHKNMKKALFFSLGLLAAGILGVFAFGKLVLQFFGAEYTQGLSLLFILALSSIPFALCILYQMKLNILGKVKRVFIMNLIVVLITLLGSFLFRSYGLSAIGFSWLIGNIVSLGWLI